MTNYYHTMHTTPRSASVATHASVPGLISFYQPLNIDRQTKAYKSTSKKTHKATQRRFKEKMHFEPSSSSLFSPIFFASRILWLPSLRFAYRGFFLNRPACTYSWFPCVFLPLAVGRPKAPVEAREAWEVVEAMTTTTVWRVRCSSHALLLP